MRILAIGLFALNVTTLFCLAVNGQSAVAEQPKFQIEIHVSDPRTPSYTVTNLTGRTVTACVVRLSSSIEKGASHTMWDALLQDVRPIEPNASFSQYAGHRVGGPLPDRVEIVAGVWSDGESFGDSEWVKMILKNRETLAGAYEQASALLQQGLEQNWTRDQYVQALNDKPNAAPFFVIRSAVTANKNFDERPELLHRMMQSMQKSFVDRSNQLRTAKLHTGPLSLRTIFGGAQFCAAV